MTTIFSIVRLLAVARFFLSTFLLSGCALFEPPRGREGKPNEPRVKCYLPSGEEAKKKEYERAVIQKEEFTCEYDGLFKCENGCELYYRNPSSTGYECVVVVDQHPGHVWHQYLYTYRSVGRLKAAKSDCFRYWQKEERP